MVCKIKLTSLRPWSPFKTTVWFGLETPITKREITSCIKHKQFKTLPLPEITWNGDNIPSRNDHCQRIAYLVSNKTKDPIQLDVGVPNLNCHIDWIISDGNHRLAAAFFRNDKYIPAHIMGSIKYAKELLNLK